MKKKLMKAAALMMAAAMAAAMPAAVMADEAEKVTIRFSWWGGDARHQQTLEAIELYESLNPNIHIEAEYQGYDGYYEKMITTLSSGTAPDLMQYHRDWVADVQGADHYLANLSELPVDLSTLPENVLNTSGSFNEEPVLYSCSVGGQVMYVNKDFAEKYNFDYEKEYTWEELMEEGSRIHEEDPEAYLMTADIDVLNRLIVLEYLAQLTGESIVTDDYKIAFTVEQMTASLENILALYESNTMEPYGESAVFVGQMEQNNKWVNGQIGLLLDISGAVAKYDASIECGVDIMAIPGQEDEVCTGVDYSGNMGFVINDNSANKEETAKFLSWMMND
ncbi:MAG: carbohydrate ABC transporter substrate-binding protein, partial [Parasporobacterium sp.]|nr:carbohydrate ABC transporter substrate-binding protein [Parasporobacterium sp.]